MLQKCLPGEIRLDERERTKVGAEVLKSDLGFISSRQQSPKIFIHGNVVMKCGWCQRLMGSRKGGESHGGGGKDAGGTW